MRIAKSDTIAGLPAPVARDLVRLHRGGTFVQELADTLLRRNGVEDTDAVFARMEGAGYLVKPDIDDPGYLWWEATTLGNAMAMASFGKPITRSTADRLVAGLLERARMYNADPGMPLFVGRLRIFGSYLDPTVDPLGDVDVELSFGMHIRDHQKISAYARASRSTFDSFMGELFWPQKELIQKLRNRSTAINITTENIDNITDNARIVYSIKEDPGAVPAPTEETAKPPVNRGHGAPRK